MKSKYKVYKSNGQSLFIIIEFKKEMNKKFANKFKLRNKTKQK